MVLSRFFASIELEVLVVELGVLPTRELGVAGVRAVLVGLRTLGRATVFLSVVGAAVDRRSAAEDTGFVVDVRLVAVVPEGARDIRFGAPEIVDFFFSSLVSIELVDIRGR